MHVCVSTDHVSYFADVRLLTVSKLLVLNQSSEGNVYVNLCECVYAFVYEVTVSKV